MKLNEEQITYIDNFLKFLNIKSLDIRIELLDHLVSEIENDKIENIDKYIIEKREFMRKFSKKRESSIHWSYQKQLWATFFSFFYKLKYLPITMSLILGFYYLIHFITIKKHIFLTFIPLLLITFYGMFIAYVKNKEVRELVSYKYLTNILSLPLLFFYSLNLALNYIFNSQILTTIYWVLGTGLAIAGVILMKQKKNSIIKKYSFLIS